MKAKNEGKLMKAALKHIIEQTKVIRMTEEFLSVMIKAHILWQYTSHRNKRTTDL